jgi:hypothetical protein
MARCCGLCDIGGDLRRDRLSWLHAAPDRAAPRAPIAILISSLFFLALHLTKAWATLGMIPIVFGAGVLLGLLAWGMIGHVMMDIGLFAYWWTGIAGDFTLRPIAETGLDQPFLIVSAAFGVRRVRDLAFYRAPRNIEAPGKNPGYVLTQCDWPRTSPHQLVYSVCREGRKI